MARILLGVSGGIAAYKSLEFARLAIKAGHTVRVVQTPASERFVGRASFEGITGSPVVVDRFAIDPAAGVFPGDARPAHDPIAHLALAERCDVMLVAPATANTIAKLAAGIADNALTALYLACRRPVVLAPAMNSNMYEHPATQANLALLARRGVTVMEPGEGSLASIGEEGIGRLPKPAELLACVDRIIADPARATGRLNGKRVLVTAGGTREPIDAVRYVGNRSSGRMGFALAAEAAAMGAEVTVVAANVDLPGDPSVTRVDVSTAAELEAAVGEHFPFCDLLIMAAAVADFRPAVTTNGKIKKSDRDELVVRLEPTIDILGGVAATRRPGQLLVGFAAEHGGDVTVEGRRKLATKDIDLIVVNDVSDRSIGFEVSENDVAIIGRDGVIEQTGRVNKRIAAARILARVAELVEADWAKAG